MLPPPDLTIWLEAPLELVIERFALRQRVLQIAQIEDLQQIDAFMQDWMSIHPPTPLLRLDVSTEEISYTSSIALTMYEITKNNQ